MELQQKGVDLSNVQEPVSLSQNQPSISMEDYLSEGNEEFYSVPSIKRPQMSSSSTAAHKAALAAAQAAASSGMFQSSHIHSTPTPASTASRQARKRKKTSSAQKEFTIPLTLPKHPASYQQDLVQEQAVNEEDDAGDQNAVYCFCRKVSYGDMVGCDSAVCGL